MDWSDALKDGRDQAATRFQNRLAWTCCAVAFVLIAAMSLPLWDGRVYIADDLGDYHLPFRGFYADAIANGHDFSWCPQVFCGYYLHGEGQVGMYHPWHRLIYEFLPLPVAFNLEILACYPFLFLGGLLFFRRHLPIGAAAFGSLLFTFCGFNLLRYVHVNALAIIAHLPWLLYCIDKLTRDPPSRGWVRLLYSSLTASQILLGYPQYVWLTLIAEVCYAVVSAPDARRWRWLAGIVYAKCLGGLVGAVQLLPTWDVLNDSIRQQASAEFRDRGSLPPLNLVQLVAPYLLKDRVLTAVEYQGWQSHEYVVYCGAALPALLVFGGSMLRRQLTNRLGRFSWFVCLLGYLLAIGAYLPGYRLLGSVPLVSLFRCPCRATMLLHLGFAGVAACLMAGFSSRRASHRSERPPRSWRRSGLTLLLLLFPLALKTLGKAGWDTLEGQLNHTSAIAWGTIQFGLALWLVRRGIASGSGWPVFALIVLTGLDLGVYGLSSRWGGRQSPTATLGELRPKLPESVLEAARVVGGNEWVLAGRSVIGGYVGLPPTRQLDYDSTAVQRLAGVAWNSAEETIDENHLPRAWLVTEVRQRTDRMVPLRAREFAWVDRPIDGVTHGSGHVEVTRNLPGRIEFDVRVSSRQLLVVSESYHSGWKVIDGNSIGRPERVFGDLMGYVVDPASPRIQFVWDPVSLKWGRWLTAFGIFIAVFFELLGAIGEWRTRRV